jgi:two-component system, NarL family, response regulator DegU
MTAATIMLVGSQPSFRALVRQALSHDTEFEATEILECDPGEDGNNTIAKIEVNSPDIVLLDIGYPVLNGLLVGKKIARAFPETRIIILSANPEKDDNELFEVTRSGAAAYLRSKHPDGAELIKAIKQVSNGEYPLNDNISNNPKVAWRILKQFHDMASVARHMGATTLPLSPNELQVLKLISEGNPIEIIEDIWGIDERTTKNQVSSILHKLNVNDRANDMFIRLRNSSISVRIARDGNLFMFNATPGFCQPQLSLDNLHHT